jgi:hypothetical protein
MNFRNKDNNERRIRITNHTSVRIGQNATAILLWIIPLIVTLFSVSSYAVRYPGDRSNYDNTSAAIYETDGTYIEECGACHMAYAPGLLPEKSWHKILNGLQDHFGENAELDSETLAYLQDYLNRNALEHEKSDKINKLMRKMPADPPVRITELPQFLIEHEPAVRQMELESVEVGFFSPCEDCHKQGASGIFDKELLYKGYGPSFEFGEKKDF